MREHESFTGESMLKRQKIESVSFQKKDTFCLLFMILLLFVLCIMCYTVYSDSFSSWESVQLDLQYEEYFRTNETSPPPTYRVHPKPTVTPNDTNSTTNPPPTTPPGPQYHVAFPKNYHFILDQADACKLRPPFLVLMVPVAPNNVEARNAIRQTWGKSGEFQGEVVLTLFILGLSGQADVEKQQEKIQHENLQHQDLILSDFIDSYFNLTIKTMVMMDWLATHCSNAAYAMKIDTDMFLNVDNLVNMLKKPELPKVNYLTGVLVKDGIVVRKKSSKWYVSKEVYPHPTYPLYAEGPGYAFSNDLPGKFVEISKTVKPVNIEDAYIGMCMKKLGLSPSSPPGPSLFNGHHGAYNRCAFSKIITSVLNSLQELVKFWTDLKKPGPPCENKTNS